MKTCKRGHELTDANLSWRTSGRGLRYPVCRLCHLHLRKERKLPKRIERWVEQCGGEEEAKRIARALWPDNPAYR